MHEWCQSLCLLIGRACYLNISWLVIKSFTHFLGSYICFFFFLFTYTKKKEKKSNFFCSWRTFGIHQCHSRMAIERAERKKYICYFFSFRLTASSCMELFLMHNILKFRHHTYYFDWCCSCFLVSRILHTLSL